MMISIHAPRVGSDHRYRPGNRRGNHFNPRSPCGERLAATTSSSSLSCDFNPRSPCGERQNGHIGKKEQKIFQSTLPVWGATTSDAESTDNGVISIHAPRVGSDRSEIAYGHTRQGISIHAPRVGSDPCNRQGCRTQKISIHAPRVGSDWLVSVGTYNIKHFNPRSPCGERLRRAWIHHQR